MPKSFKWTAPSGVEISLMPMGRVPTGIVRRHRHEDPVDFIFSMLEEIADEETLAKVDELPSEDLNKMVEAWQEETGSAGESSGSST